METEAFRKTYEVTWDQQDPIGHLRGIAHYGYGQRRLAESGYDPIVLRLEARYHHEVLLGETVIDILQPVAPDKELLEILNQVQRGPNFESMRSIIRFAGT